MRLSKDIRVQRAHPAAVEVLRYIERREREYELLISRVCEGVRHDGAPRLAFPGSEPCPLEPGDEISAAAGLDLIVERVRRSKKGEHVVTYSLRDFRVRLPRRVPPNAARSRQHLDEYGMPPAPTPDEIKLASIEGGRTSAKALAVPGHDLAENVEGEDYRLIQMASRKRWAEHEKDERAERVAHRQGKQLVNRLRKIQAEAARSGLDITPRLAAMVREAEQELAEHRRDAA